MAVFGRAYRNLLYLSAAVFAVALSGGLGLVWFTAQWTGCSHVDFNDEGILAAYTATHFLLGLIVVWRAGQQAALECAE